MTNTNYKQSSTKIALDLVNKRIEGYLPPDEIKFTNVTYLEEGVWNTRATITPLEDSDLQEEFNVEYDRINIGSFFLGVDVVVEPMNQRLVSEYLPSINNQFNLGLTSEDIVDGLIPATAKPPIRIEIKINPNNPAYYGSFIILISNPRKSIRSMVEGVELGKIKYVQAEKGKIQGPIYSLSKDWSYLKDTFNSYNTIKPLDRNFADMLNLYDVNTWVYQQESLAFNLYNAKVVYIGPSDNELYKGKVGFQNVFVIELDPNYCNNIAGRLILSY